MGKVVIEIGTHSILKGEHAAMKNFFRVVFIGLCVIFLGYQFEIADERKMNSKTENELEVRETMNTPIYVDPEIDLSSQKNVSIIIHFKTKPAKIAVIEAQAKGLSLSLEKAEKDVRDSHTRFHKEIQTLLEKENVPYSITRTFKIVYNGVAMELPAYEIQRLPNSVEISTIHVDREIQLEPPILPVEQM